MAAKRSSLPRRRIGIGQRVRFQGLFRNAATIEVRCGTKGPNTPAYIMRLVSVRCEIWVSAYVQARTPPESCIMFEIYFKCYALVFTCVASVHSIRFPQRCLHSPLQPSLFPLPPSLLLFTFPSFHSFKLKHRLRLRSISCDRLFSWPAPFRAHWILRGRRCHRKPQVAWQIRNR